MIAEIVKQAERECEPIFKEITKIAENNQKRVLDAFIGQKVSDSHFHSTTGYGYDDMGRMCRNKYMPKFLAGKMRS